MYYKFPANTAKLMMFKNSEERQKMGLGEIMWDHGEKLINVN